jgi:cytochrome P450
MVMIMQLIQERIEGKDNAPDDLLSTMLNGKDPKTGQSGFVIWCPHVLGLTCIRSNLSGKGLSPENIRYQLVTFLIAGHEVSYRSLNGLFPVRRP